MDITQRIPHTFGALGGGPPVETLLKRFFDELPYQCINSGLRFSSREKLRKHHDALIKRRSTQQHKQRGTEARGWMEPIPEWVGNRDLVVGPALFRLGGAGDDGGATAEDGLRGGDASVAEDGEDK